MTIYAPPPRPKFITTAKIMPAIMTIPTIGANVKTVFAVVFIVANAAKPVVPIPDILPATL